MAIVDPDRDQGKALFEGSQSFEDHDDISDHKTGGVYDHVAKEFSATEAESWCDLLRYIIEHSKDGLLALPVRNETGGTIVAATSPLVYVTGYSAAQSRFLIAKADATDGAKIAQFVLIADLANNTNGVAYANSDEVAVTYPADVRTGGLDTSGATAVGDVVYTSVTTPGAWQYTAPVAPNYPHAVGRVIVKHAANGEILFYPGGAGGVPAHVHTATDITSGTLVHERGGLEADVSAGDGFVQIKSGATAVIKTNHAATTAPGTGNDNTQGYAIGSRWIDTTNDKEYVVTDVTTGAALWKETTGGGTFDASAITTGQLALARGGTHADLSATGGAGQFLKQSSAGANITVGTIGASDLPSHNHAASNINSGTLAHERGGLEADISTIVKGDLIVGTGTGTAGLKNVGANGTFLKADSTQAGGVTWATVNAAMPPIVFYPQSNEPPSSAAAAQDLRNQHPVLDFDGATDEEAVWTGFLPASYAGGGLTVKIFVSFTSATSGTARFQADIERIALSSQDIDSDGFTGSFQSAGVTVPGTSGHVVACTITFTSGAQMDSLAAGELFRLKIRRDADGTSGTDDVTTDAEVLCVVVTET